MPEIQAAPGEFEDYYDLGWNDGHNLPVVFYLFTEEDFDFPEQYTAYCFGLADAKESLR